jgi:hypothetical protein
MLLKDSRTLLEKKARLFRPDKASLDSLSPKADIFSQVVAYRTQQVNVT